MVQTFGNTALKEPIKNQKQRLTRAEQSSVAEQFWKQQRAEFLKYGQQESVDAMLARRRGMGLEEENVPEGGSEESNKGGNVIEMPRRLPPAKAKIPLEGEKNAEGWRDAAKQGFRLATDWGLRWATNYCATFEPFGILLLAAPYMNLHAMMRYLLQRKESFRDFKPKEMLTLALVDLVIGIIVMVISIMVMAIYAVIKKFGGISVANFSIQLVTFLVNPLGYIEGYFFSP